MKGRRKGDLEDGLADGLVQQKTRSVLSGLEGRRVGISDGSVGASIDHGEPAVACEDIVTFFLEL